MNTLLPRGAWEQVPGCSASVTIEAPELEGSLTGEGSPLN